MKSKWQLHCDTWRDGCGSEYCSAANKIVLGKGKLPCDVLFIGEAPGASEDVLGRPFVGPAGKVLDLIISRVGLNPSACPECGSECSDTASGITCKNGHGGVLSREEFSPGKRLAFTNLVGCIPRGGDHSKITEPDDEQIMSCRDRLAEFIKIADPKLIVTCGKHSDLWTDPHLKTSVKFHKPIQRVNIMLPAAILRAPVAAQGLLVQRAEVALAYAMEEAFQG